MRALVEALHSLLIALAAGRSVAVLIVVLICLIAFVAGSAYGIFFAAEAPARTRSPYSRRWSSWAANTAITYNK